MHSATLQQVAAVVNSSAQVLLLGKYFKYFTLNYIINVAALPHSTPLWGLL